MKSIYKNLMLSSLVVLGMATQFSGIEVASKLGELKGADQPIASGMEGNDGTAPHRGSGR
jgi:hypothetical protein